MAGKCTYFAESIKYSITLCASWDGRHAFHLGKGSSSGGDNISKACNDLRERSQANDNQGTVDEVDRLSRFLESLTLLREHVDVFDDLSRCGLRSDRSSKSQSGGDDVAEGDHDYFSRSDLVVDKQTKTES